MLVADMLNPPIQYDLIWLIIGLCLLVTIPLSYAGAFWWTRRRPINSIDNLPTLPVGADLDRLKAKYLRLIDERYVRFQRGELTLRALHRELSLLTRYFVYEAKHFPAPTLTLSDLKRGPYPLLTKLIAFFYPQEFARIEHGDAPSSVTQAKGFITQWS
jgi:hypothetical protein